jgi:phage terminase large subunit
VRYLARGGGGLYARRYARFVIIGGSNQFPAISFPRKGRGRMEAQNEKTVNESQYTTKLHLQGSYIGRDAPDHTIYGFNSTIQETQHAL